MANPIKLKCVVTSITKHGDSVFSVRLLPTRRLPNYFPGQFLHLALDPFEPSGGFWPESRIFSIASPPYENEITIAYAIKGKFTERMSRELFVGKEVWVKLPYGHFTLSVPVNEEAILIAGGTGITPFISFISMELNRPTDIRIKLFYGVRKPELFLFKDILSQAILRLKDFNLHIFCEEEIAYINGIPVQKGIITFDSIWSASKDPYNCVYYLSGPIEMIHKFKNSLLENGIGLSKIRIDEWE